MAEAELDQDALKRFTFSVWSYKQGEMVSLMIHIGDRLGLYAALDGIGPVTAAQLAERTGLKERWLLEWLRGQAAARLLDYHDGDRFELDVEARDAREVQRAYANRDDDRAAFLLWKVTENCVVCHTRLQSREDSPLSEGFVASGVLEGLPPEQKAALQIATRRFDGDHSLGERQIGMDGIRQHYCCRQGNQNCARNGSHLWGLLSVVRSVGIGHRVVDQLR